MLKINLKKLDFEKNVKNIKNSKKVKCLSLNNSDKNFGPGFRSEGAEKLEL